MDIRNQSIEDGGTYHIFNKGSNDINIFTDSEDYKYFITLLIKYILPVATVYSWALLRNHFHILLHIKEDIQYKWTKKTLPTKDSNIWATEGIQLSNVNNRIPIAVNHFRHLFNAYAHYFNLKHKRKGSLFDKPYKRVLIENDKHLINELLYINTNAVKHGFSIDSFEWKWSSANEIIHEKSELTDVEYVISLFDGVQNFQFILNNSSGKYDSELE